MERFHIADSALLRMKVTVLKVTVSNMHTGRITPTGNTVTLRATLSTLSTIQTAGRSNQGPCGDRPATKRLTFNEIINIYFDIQRTVRRDTFL